MATVLSPFEARDAQVRGERTITCRVATTPLEREIHFRIRHEVFVAEQGFFSSSDRDERDDDPATILVLGCCGRVAAGAVRLYPRGRAGEWKGDRLAVLPRFRRYGVGRPLVRFAVRPASERGGDVMVARVQVQNVGFFEHLGWHRRGEAAEYLGRTHQAMAIGLS
jgi:putative N-acetyltransferase (TIGR04045 family)